MAILTADDWKSVRAALDVDLDETGLPNKTIALDIFSGAAQREVRRRVDDAENKTGDDLLRVSEAAVLLTAARLASSTIRPTSITVQTRDMNYSRPAWKSKEKSAELRQMASEAIDDLNKPDDVLPYRMTAFAKATGRRGQ